MGCLCGRKNRSPCAWQREAKICSTIDMVLAAIGIITSGTDLEILMEIQVDSTKSLLEKDQAMKMVYLLCVAVGVNLIKLAAGSRFWIGVKDRNHDRCRNWLMITIAMWLIQLASFLVSLKIGFPMQKYSLSTMVAFFGRVFAIIVFVSKACIKYEDCKDFWQLILV